MTTFDGTEHWADRVRLFLETRNYDHVTQDDLDKLHEHWTFGLRLHQLVLPVRDAGPPSLDGTQGAPDA